MQLDISILSFLKKHKHKAKERTFQAPNKDLLVEWVFGSNIPHDTPTDCKCELSLMKKSLTMFGSLFWITKTPWMIFVSYKLSLYLTKGPIWTCTENPADLGTLGMPMVPRSLGIKNPTVGNEKHLENVIYMNSVKDTLLGSQNLRILKQITVTICRPWMRTWAPHYETQNRRPRHRLKSANHRKTGRKWQSCIQALSVWLKSPCS